MSKRARRSSGGWATGSLLAVLFLLADVVFSGALSSATGWLGYFALEFYACQLSLLAIWLGMGNSHLPLRILTAVPAGFLVWWLAIERDPWDEFSQRYLPFYWLTVPMMSLPCLGMQAVGFRVTHPDPVSPADRGRGPIQFSLRQAFGLTIVAALAAFALRVCYQVTSIDSMAAGWAGLEIVYNRLLVIHLGVMAIAAPLTVGVLLNTVGGVGRRLLMFVALAIATECAAVVATIKVVADVSPSADFSWHEVLEMGVTCAQFVAPHLIMTSAALLALRWRGYRLVRISPARKLRTDEQTLADAV